MALAGPGSDTPAPPPLPACGAITPRIVDAFFDYLAANQVVFMDTRRRATVWSSYLSAFTVEDLKCLTRHALKQKRLLSLEMSLAWLQESKVVPLPIVFPGRPVLTATGSDPETAACLSATPDETSGLSSP